MRKPAVPMSCMSVTHPGRRCWCVPQVHSALGDADRRGTHHAAGSMRGTFTLNDPPLCSPKPGPNRAEFGKVHHTCDGQRRRPLPPLAHDCDQCLIVALELPLDCVSVGINRGRRIPVGITASVVSNGISSWGRTCSAERNCWRVARKIDWGESYRICLVFTLSC